MVELKFNQKKQNIRVFKDILSDDDCEKKILFNKEKAFGVISKIFDKKSTIEITHKEKKYYPFWHIKAESFIEYTKKNNYSFSVEPQVRTVTIAGEEFQVAKESPVCHVKAEDYCVEHYTKDDVRDATDMGVKEKKLDSYLKFESKQIYEVEELMGHDKVVFPVTVRGSFIVRDLFKELLKPVQADKIITEKIEVTEMTLYFRPAYAFELTKKVNGKTSVLEIDALTGDIHKSSVIRKELQELMPENVLFDVGAEVASMIIPGASAAAVIGKQIHERHKKKKAIEQMKTSQRAMDSHSSSKKSSGFGSISLRGK
jgi:hypothetical protein